MKGINKDKFEEAFRFMFAHEGGTSNDPVDRGGLTKFGICEREYPHLDIVNLTVDDVMTIYQEDYWKPVQGDKLPGKLATVMFDSAVNCGQGSAVKWLQRSMNLMGSNLHVDGDLGPITLGEIGKYGVQKLIQGVITYRLQRYERLIKKHPEQMRFIRGWIRRVISLSTYSLT